jgi:intracellular septation protein A
VIIATGDADPHGCWRAAEEVDMMLWMTFALVAVLGSATIWF